MIRRALLASVLTVAAAAVPARGAREYVAVGDSITTGSSWPVTDCEICPVVFDCTGGCAATSAGREKCGHARRLDDWIDTWAGAADHVVNEGWGAEWTEEALARLPGVLDAECGGSPGSCNAVILKHGTNDMFASVSPETARDHLAMMIAEAKSRGIDTLLVTIIRRVYQPSNTKWRDYKDLTLALAASESLQSVNAWLTLCATTTCFNNKYWVDHANSQCTAPGEGDHLIGHLDPNGYDTLTDLIKAAFPGAAPAVPSPTSPGGDIADAMPVFTWDVAATARWYALEVDGATTWWEAAAHCGGGSCSADPGVGLAEGTHSWRVRGRNLRGLGNWSADSGFEIWPVPAKPSLIEPAGLQVDGTPMAAPFSWEPFQWSEVAGATDYDLEIADGGGTVLSQSFDSSICSGSICSAEPGQGLAAGGYTWTVQARNPATSGPVSDALAFEVFDTVPGEATPTAPGGDFFEPFTPLYEWLPAAGATEYDIEVTDAAMNVDASAGGLQAAAVCAGGTCSYQGGTLADPDDYALSVRGRNDVGDGPWSSAAAEFTVLACTDQTERDLSDFVTSGAVGTHTVRHCGPLTAAATADFEIEATGDLSVLTREEFIAQDGFRVKGKLKVRSQ